MKKNTETTSRGTRKGRGMTLDKDWPPKPIPPEKAKPKSKK